MKTGENYNKVKLINTNINSQRPHSRNVIPSALNSSVGSFIYFDHLGPFDFPAGCEVFIPPHPHAGIATISYMFEGEGHHHDSIGSNQIIEPGRLNYMNSGNGIIHSEGLSKEFSKTGGRLCGFQIWHLLSSSERNADASFQTFADKELPKLKAENGVIVSLLLGKYEQINSPVKTQREILMLTIQSNKKAEFIIKLNKNWEYFVYLCDGLCMIDDSDIGLGQGLKITNKNESKIFVNTNCKAVLIGGPPLDEVPTFNESLVSVGDEQMKDYYKRLNNNEFGIL